MKKKIIESSGSNINYIIIPLVILLLLMSSMLVLAFIRMKKLKNAQAITFDDKNKEDDYNFIDINENLYDEIGENDQGHYYLEMWADFEQCQGEHEDVL